MNSVFAAEKLFSFSNRIAQYINQDKKYIEQSFGFPVKMTNGSIYKDLPDVVFIYDDYDNCIMISAPLHYFFDIKGYSKITSEVLEEQLGVSIYTANNFNFDWFGTNGYIFTFAKSKNGLKADTVVNITRNHVYQVQRLNYKQSY